jgi:hypothetical protein
LSTSIPQLVCEVSQHDLLRNGDDGQARRVSSVIYFSVFAVEDDGEPIAGDGGKFMPALSGIWVDIGPFATVVVVAVGIEAGEARAQEMGRGWRSANTFTCIRLAAPSGGHVFQGFELR